MRVVLVLSAVVTLTLTFAVVGTAGAQTDADPGVSRRSALELAQQRLDEARRLATDAAQRLADAESRRGSIAQEIAAAEDEIPRLRARADDLRRAIRERAARLYVRSSTPPLDIVTSASSVVDAQRAEHLTSTIGDHEEAVAAELQSTAHTLEVRQAQLQDQRAELDRSIAAITPLRDALDKQLDVAGGAYDKVKAALASRTDQPDVPTGAAVCPVKGFVVFTDDFGEPRDGGTLHQGIDMPSKEGTPVAAVVDGFMARDVSDAGGNGAWVRGGDDVSYYYAHFSRYEGEAQGWVKAGDVIGYVGSTGDSTGPHLHFEVHPNGGPAVDGFPLLLSLCADETLLPTK
jgi:murein DD-endopeptidase MepM/ murein hydrolase activator NlpD